MTTQTINQFNSLALDLILLQVIGGNLDDKKAITRKSRIS